MLIWRCIIFVLRSMETQNIMSFNIHQLVWTRLCNIVYIYVVFLLVIYDFNLTVTDLRPNLTQFYWFCGRRSDWLIEVRTGSTGVIVVWADTWVCCTVIPASQELSICTVCWWFYVYMNDSKSVWVGRKTPQGPPLQAHVHDGQVRRGPHAGCRSIR